MPRVICTLPNASQEISGVKFHPLDDGGLVSDEITAEQAEVFLSIQGYEPWDDATPAPVDKPVEAPPKTRPAKKAADSQSPAPAVDEVF